MLSLPALLLISSMAGFDELEMCGSEPRMFSSGEGESNEVLTYFSEVQPLRPVLADSTFLSFSSAALLGVTHELRHYKCQWEHTVQVGRARHRFCRLRAGSIDRFCSLCC